MQDKNYVCWESKAILSKWFVSVILDWGVHLRANIFIPFNEISGLASSQYTSLFNWTGSVPDIPNFFTQIFLDVFIREVRLGSISAFATGCVHVGLICTLNIKLVC